MTAQKSMKVIIVLFMSILSAALISAPVMAFESHKKTAEETAADNEKRAVDYYNDGVKAMDAGKEAGQKTDSLYAYNYRATTDARARKQFEKAVDKFNKSVGLKPDMAEAYNNLGYCYRKLGKLDASMTAYDKAIELKKDFAQAYEYRGETFLALGQLDKAQADLETLKQLKSPLAEDLSKSIEVYQLEHVKGAQHSSKW